MTTPRSCSARTFGLAAVTALLALPAAQAADFNGDGYPDLAIGCHGEWVAGQQEAGAVHVFYGGPTCFGTFTEQVITEASFGGFAFPDDFELFGLSVTSGDFDADGYDDLAVSGANETVSGLKAAGMVFVVYGSAAGLDLDRHDAFSQDTKGIKDKVEDGHFFIEDLSAEQFGRTLAAGDFNADGYDDLAIFVQESFGGGKKLKSYAGAVHVLKGSATGLVVKGNKLLRQGKAGIPGKLVADGKFGWAMGVADFNQDGIDDLAVGAPGELVEGTVSILLGKAKKGLTGKHSVIFDESDADGTPDPLKAHHFGETLEVGHFSGPGGAPQLVIGAPLMDVGATEYAGGVYVLTLDPATLAITDSQQFTRATPGIDGGVQSIAQFGAALAAGDFDGDGDDDLAIGCRNDDLGEAEDAGSVTVLTGSGSGLLAAQLLVTQDVSGVPEVAEDGDLLGGALAAADYDDDGDADLIIGCPGETIGALPTAGGVLVLEGGAGLLDLAGGLWLDKSLPVVAGNPAGNDTFGSALGR